MKRVGDRVVIRLGSACVSHALCGASPESPDGVYFSGRIAEVFGGAPNTAGEAPALPDTR